MMKFIIYIIFLSSSLVSSQSQLEFNKYEPKKSIGAILKSDFNTSFNNTLSLFQSPFQFDKNDLILTGFLAALTAGTFTVDNKIRRDVVKTRSKELDRS